MKKKKIVALLTACMLMTGMFTGCGSSQQAAGSSGAEAGQTQTGDNSLFNEPGQLPIVNEPVTLTVFAPANPDGSWEDNEMVKEVYFKYIKANTKDNGNPFGVADLCGFR